MTVSSDISSDVIAPKSLIIPVRTTISPIEPRGSLFLSGNKIIYSNGSNMWLLSGTVVVA